MKYVENISEILKTKYYEIENINDLKDLLYNSAKKFKNKLAFKFKNEDGKVIGITYGKFAEDVESLGNYLISLGFDKKAIGIIGKNSYKWIVSYFAAACIGIVVPIDKELFSSDIINFLNVSECSCLIGDR